MKRLNQYLTGKIVLLFFFPTLLIYVYMFFISMPAIASFSSGLPIFDLKPGYNYTYAIKLLETLGMEGRLTYLFPQLILDMFFPLAYVPFFVLLSGLLLKKNKLYGTAFNYTLLIPVITGLADYGENISSIILINSFPDISVSLVEFASACTIVKSIGLVLSIFMLMLYGVLTFCRKND